MLSIDKINSLTYETKLTHCQGCTNHCYLTINKFSGNRQFITGNRCERGLGREKSTEKLPNLFDYKLKRLFGYEPLSESEAVRGVVGIPRVLNMYENYPFWFTFLQSSVTALSFHRSPAVKFTNSVSNPSHPSPNVTRQSSHTATFHG